MMVSAIQKAAMMASGAAACLALAGCHVDMWNQEKPKPYQEDEFFANHAASRPLVEHTVARGELRTDEAFYTGMVHVSGTQVKYVEKFPFPITKEVLQRGQERFSIYCVPCHGELGNGKGFIAQRGFALRRQPGNYHTDRLRKMPIGHFFDVITNGYGAMYSYASRVEPEDRWKIVAYIRVLQLSQDAPAADVPPSALEHPSAPAGSAGGNVE
jgi:mono/diheme cytochrome c family protein